MLRAQSLRLGLAVVIAILQHESDVILRARSDRKDRSLAKAVSPFEL
jgi:hypothetical protein